MNEIVQLAKSLTLFIVAGSLAYILLRWYLHAITKYGVAAAIEAYLQTRTNALLTPLMLASIALGASVHYVQVAGLTNLQAIALETISCAVAASLPITLRLLFAPWLPDSRMLQRLRAQKQM